MWVDMADPDPEERYVGKVAHPTKVMVWGAISYTGRSRLHFFDSKVDGKEYQQAVEQAMLDVLYDPEFMNCDKSGYVFRKMELDVTPAMTLKPGWSRTFLSSGSLLGVVHGRQIVL